MQTVAEPGKGFRIEGEKVHGGKVAGTSPKLLAAHIVDKGNPHSSSLSKVRWRP
jgi:hypothetical protein